MRFKLRSLLTIFSGVVQLAFAVTTWPSSIDELEDIMLLNTGYNARELSFTVSPCSFQPTPGQLPAAGLVRTAFHDMITANVAGPGLGGLDASIAYELSGVYALSNSGPGFNSSLTYLSQFFSSQASMSDLIALGLYTAVRGCGGPNVAVRAGRIDATQAGPTGVPAPTDSAQSLQSAFSRVGFSTQDMIKVVACGHTLGGVDSAELPSAVPSNAPNGVAGFDSTQANFDNKVAYEFVTNQTNNPLVVGPTQFASDARVFKSDGGVTIGLMSNADNFQSSCASVLQKLIDTVPSTVTLSDPIQAYDVKPANLELAVTNGGTELNFTGEIRVKTTTRSVEKVELQCKDRMGQNTFAIETTVAGSAAGYDDLFTFYSFSKPISAFSSLSSFTVIVTDSTGQVETFDNNGSNFPVQDVCFWETSASGFDSSGNLKVVAAVRDAQSVSDVDLTLDLVIPQAGLPVPVLQTVSIGMSPVSSAGLYTFYEATHSLGESIVNNTRFDISATVEGRKYVDAFNSLYGLGSLRSIPIGPSSSVTTTITTGAASGTGDGFDGSSTTTMTTTLPDGKSTWPSNSSCKPSN